MKFNMPAIAGLTFLICAIAVSTYAQEEPKLYKEFSAEVELNNRFFFEDGSFEGQERNYFSIAFQPEVYLEWNEGYTSFKFTGFGRIDQHDSRRTHFDIRELYWQKVKGNTEISIGFKKIFWGKTESVHLVDIINQTDQVESFDGEDKLGEAMIHLSQFTNIGTFDFFVLPYFRKRVFPGPEGRFRTPIVLDGDEFEFEGDEDEFRPSFAFRWSHYIGVFDIGVSHFYGTGREPIIADFSTFEAIYGVINQTGIDLQATTGPWLWKAETIIRRNDFQDLFAFAGGVEYTFGNIGGKGLDIGILGEYLFDDRDELALSSLQNDIFTGMRFAFNDIKDTQILTGAIFDLERSSRIYSLEADRRIGNSWSVEAVARVFDNISSDEFLTVFQYDSFLEFAITKYF
ncbi:MAG: hypothetical protein AAF363_20470 [Bacteroidota bacterium]